MSNGLYHDSVVAFNTVKFNGTPDQVRQWILDNDPVWLSKAHDVMVGGTLETIGISDYLNRNANAA